VLLSLRKLLVVSARAAMMDGPIAVNAMGRHGADSGDCGRGFRLIVDSDSD
jgi:hypothetical protein